MSISKVKTVSNAGQWTGNYGTMYTQICVLEDGTSGEVSAKTENRWAVGDEVQYEVVGKAPNGNFKLKFSKPESAGFSNSSNRSFSPDREKDIVAGMISNQIIQLVCAGKIESVGNVTDGAIKELLNLRERVKGLQ